MHRTEPPSGRVTRHALVAAAIAITSLSGTPADLTTTFSTPALAATQAYEGNGDRPKGTVWVVNRAPGKNEYAAIDTRDNSVIYKTSSNSMPARTH